MGNLSHYSHSWLLGSGGTNTKILSVLHNNTEQKFLFRNSCLKLPTPGEPEQILLKLSILALKR